MILLAALALAIWVLAAPPRGEPTAAAAGASPSPQMAVMAPTPPIASPVPQVEPTVSLPTATLATATLAPPTALPQPTTTVAPPTAAPPPVAPPERFVVNGIPYEVVIVLPESALHHARQIFAAGQAIGRNPHAFSKVGDSTTEAPHFLVRYDTGPYELGPFASLQPVISAFAGSFARDSQATAIGLHSWSANDPQWADKAVCAPNETPVACEIRLNNPSILFIRLGTNDVGVPESFDRNIRQIVETAIAAGVIPVIGTKADRHEGSNENNDILRRIAANYQIPLWDFDRVADTLPGRGLDVDNAHMMTFFSHDFNDPTAFTRGHAMHNLTALMMLDALWRDVMQGGS